MKGKRASAAARPLEKISDPHSLASNESENIPQLRLADQPSFLPDVFPALDIVLVLTLDGDIVDANETAVRAYGFEREQLLRKNVTELRASSHSDFVAHELREAREHGIRFETVHSRADGTVFPVEVVSSSASIRGRRLLLSVIRDITDRKQAELALARSEAMLRICLEAAQMGTWDWDLQTGTLFWGERCKALFGLPPAADVSYDAFLAAIHPEDRPHIDRALTHALREGAEYDVEMRVPLSHGSQRWIRSKGKVMRNPAGIPVRMSGCALDVTNRKEYEQALEQSEERFRQTFDNAATGITHVGLDGRWLRVNQKLCEITGYSEQELLAKTFQDITHPDDLEADLQQVRRLLAGEILQYTMEKRYLKRDGQAVWVTLSVSLVRKADGVPDHFISVIIDITDRKRFEDELQKRQEDLEEAQRVGRLGSWFWIPSTNTVTWSKELYEIAGYDAGAAAPGFYAQKSLFSAESWRRLKTMVETALREGRGYESDLELIRPDGAHRWVAVRAEVEQDGSGNASALRGTVLDITDRIQAEHQLRRAHQQLEGKVKERTAELAAANQRLRVLTGRLLQLQDDERRKLSRELHDSAGQMLAALSMNCAALAQHITAPAATHLIADCQELITQMSSEIRTMSYLLHPPLLDEVGLESALRWYIDGFSNRSGIQTSLAMRKDFGRLSKEQEITLFRVVQESLTNVLRHSGSQSAKVELRRAPNQVELEIIDHGKGISPAQLATLRSGSTGVGLGGMRERLSQFGGELSIDSSGVGTKVIAKLPIGARTAQS